MSMDMGEFEHAVADRFGDRFSPSSLANVDTPAQLIDLLAASAPSSDDARSIKQHAFDKVQSLLARQLRCDPKLILPDTRLDVLMPDLARRRVDWDVVRTALATPGFPPLLRPRWLEWGIASSSGAVFLIFLSIAVKVHAPPLAILPATIGLTCLFLYRALERSRAYATIVPAMPATVGDLAALATAYGSPLLDAGLVPSNRSQITEVVQELVRLEMGTSDRNLQLTWKDLVRRASRPSPLDVDALQS